MLDAHLVVPAVLVGSAPALPLGGVLFAHEASAADVIAADPHCASMSAQVLAVRIEAESVASLNRRESSNDRNYLIGSD